ncbi:MAG: hypothetical protein OEM04_12335, partial [Flavobacteriaceae bacterium]|nr:hypothetical protein [Flavobacteriaceae bacterium]
EDHSKIGSKMTNPINKTEKDNKAIRLNRKIQYTIKIIFSNSKGETPRLKIESVGKLEGGR